MPNPELGDKTRGLFRPNHPNREPLRGDCSGRARNHHEAPADNVYVRNLLNRNIGVNRVEVIHCLLIQVPAISQTKTKPATRIDLDAAEGIHRTILKSIRRAATDILS